MANLVIVAIPAEDDYVWKISSEKVPHMTLLFLGDVEGKPVSKIQDFLQHAASILELGPFGLEVDRRGTLGEDEADVVFFRKDPWSFKRISEFRGQLLKNTPIKSAYDSVEQFPEWQPHLTLGYPETPAKEDKRDYPGIRWVEFDKIALWYGDFEGAEFQLRWKEYDLAEVGMSSIADAGKEFLEHYGIKGMRWGVRQNGAASDRQITRMAKRLHKEDVRAERKKPAEVQVQSSHTVSGKAKVKTAGGQRQPVHEDAVKVAEARQKLKKSGADALSNKELSDVATRLNLEVNVKRLETEHRSAGKKFVRKQLGNQTQRLGSEFVTSTINRAVKR